MADEPQPAVPPQAKRRLRWRSILLEASFVTLGVLLALAADEWRESYNQRRHAATALASVREEIEANHKAVRESLDYHMGVSNALRAFTQQARQGDVAAPRYPDSRIFSQGFVKPASLLYTAWEAANATNAVSHMAYTDVLALGRIYEQQRYYEKQSEHVGQLIFATLFHEGFQGMVQNYANLSVIVRAFSFRECQLLEAYAEGATKLDRVKGGGRAEFPEACRRMLER
jgi:hypothetical protein